MTQPYHRRLLLRQRAAQDLRPFDGPRRPTKRRKHDDIIRVLLDPFQDKRNAYVFFVNARGARSEGLAFGEHSSLNWDGIWEAEEPDPRRRLVHRDPIPFKTISFKPDLASWGINVERYIARKQETDPAVRADADNLLHQPRRSGRSRGDRRV